MSSNKFLKVTLKKSLNRRRREHQDTVRALGLRRLHHTVKMQDTPTNRGMINKVIYLLIVEECA